MKNILIVTVIKVINYGAILQAFATNQTIKKLGASPVFLNYKEKEHSFKKFLKAKSMKAKLFFLREKFLCVIHCFKLFSKKNRFNKFIKNNFALTRKYSSPEQVMKNPPKADMYMTGSDQMFNAKNTVNAAYFLEFAEDNAKRFSYATSMGNFLPPANLKQRFFDDLKKYSKLSLREIQAKEYVEKHGLSAHQHIDPTFLLTPEEWTSLIKDAAPIIKEPYILVYHLLSHPLTDELLKKLKTETGYRIVCIPKNSFIKINADTILRDVGPLEFLNLFKHASQVVTTSFHGTCFSIIFKKPFYSLAAKDEKRITSLSELLHLQNRVFKDNIILDDAPINWDFCDNVLKKERERSLKYLTECIQEGEI